MATPISTLRVFVGYDPRQPLAYNVLQHSIVRHSSRPVSVTPLILSQLPIKRRGLTEFTYSRFLVPWLCGYEGRALFLDPDMVVTGDIAELFDLADDHAVQVCKDQQKFEWASLMLFDCDHQDCVKLTPEKLDQTDWNPLALDWTSSVGELPKEWNQCIGYGNEQPAKLYHYTQGLPCWFETQDAYAADIWRNEANLVGQTCSWKELMASSVHAKTVLAKLLQRYAQ